MSYITLITNAGLAKITAALAGGTQITMGQIAIGDGNGSATIPSQTQTALVNERYRATANQVAINSEGKLVAELVVPQSVGGFTVREIALFDSDGQLFAVGSTPAIQKPSVVENAAAELVIRLIVAISNTTVIQLTASNLILATRDWVEANFAIDALFPGGTTNQVLAKKSNLDGDTEWRDPAAVNVTVNVIEETQTLTGVQTVVTLATATTMGAAVYIDGIRLPRSRYTVNSATQITLAQAYPAGTLITVAQNEPSGQIQAVPVGQIVMLGLSAHPAQLFGYGTWAQVGQGRAIFGLDASDTDFNTMGKTGGQKLHWHTGSTENAGAHNHGAATAAAGQHNHGAVTSAGGDHNHGSTTGNAGAHAHGSITGAAGAHNHTGNAGNTTLTEAQIPAHDHDYRDRYYSEAGGSLITATYKEAAPQNYNNNLGAADTDLDNNMFMYIDKTTSPAGGGEAHSHTIAAEAAHTHSVTEEPAHNHSIASSGTHTHAVANDGQHTHGVTTDGTHNHNFNTMQAAHLPPYFTVAMWQRTA
jgi:hypothetical protein